MTGPYARRITPRRHVALAGIEPATSGFKVRRPSPAETPGLDIAAALAAELLVTDFRTLSADGVRSPPVSERTETKQPRAWHPALASGCVLSEYWAQAGGNPVFPDP